uniref:Uncharacterized protein n=1 Tax=Arundo donax TaxID=35708 RepID=A0A0A8XVS1_ARUDO
MAVYPWGRLFLKKNPTFALKIQESNIVP